MEQVQVKDKEHGEESHGMVGITINGQGYSIHKGERSVTEIKALAGVHPADKLNEVVNGVLVPLYDDAKVKIKGGEVFASQPCDGKSS